MSAELPDDLSQWPTDPYALLGVRPGVDPNNLKRAYVRLIRRFKPEQFPEQFLRIREAYDNLQRYARFYEIIHQSPPEPTETPDRPAAEVDDPPPAPTPVRPDDPSAAERAESQRESLGARLSSDDALHKIWDRACAGEEAQAYRQLREWQERPRDGGDASVRLFWLLRACPELDPSRQPVEWLIRALARSGFAGPAHELLRRELYDFPGSALCDAFAGLWLGPAPLERIAEIAECRWHALGLIQQNSVVVRDIECLRAPCRAGADAVWLRLLFTAADLLAWADVPEISDPWHACLDEIAALDYHAQQMPWAFDRLDYLQELVPSWQALAHAGAADEVVRLIPLTWTRAHDELRPMFMAWFAKFEASPDSALREFDRLMNPSTAVALAWLAGVVRDLADGRALQKIDQAHEALMRGFANPAFWMQTQAQREDLLDFCLNEAIAPESVADFAARQGLQTADGTTPSQMIENDKPLLLVYHGMSMILG